MRTAAAPLLRRLGSRAGGGLRAAPCRCAPPLRARRALSFGRRTLSTEAPEPQEPPEEPLEAPLEALPEAPAILDLALSKGKMKRLKEIAAQKGIDSAGTSRPELVQRILSSPSGSSRAEGEPEQEQEEQEQEDDEAPRPRRAYSEQLKQVSKAYHELVTRMVTANNTTAVEATLTRARAAGVEDWYLETALDLQPAPSLDSGAAPASPPSPESLARVAAAAAQRRAALDAAEAAERAEAVQAADAAARDAAQEAERIESAVAEDDRSAADVREACKLCGLSSSGKREELLRRLLQHESWCHASLGGALPEDLTRVRLPNYTAGQLKVWCEADGLSMAGKKHDLIDRLSGFDDGARSGLNLREIGFGSRKQKYELYNMNASGATFTLKPDGFCTENMFFGTENTRKRDDHVHRHQELSVLRRPWPWCVDMLVCYFMLFLSGFPTVLCCFCAENAEFDQAISTR